MLIQPNRNHGSRRQLRFCELLTVIGEGRGARQAQRLAATSAAQQMKSARRAVMTVTYLRVAAAVSIVVCRAACLSLHHPLGRAQKTDWSLTDGENRSSLARPRRAL